MLAIERRKHFLDIITNKRIATVSELALNASVTEETVRRDLQIMEDCGQVVRTHGGAVINDIGSNNEAPADVRQKVNFEGKEKIARAAAKLIEYGDTIFLDASTTAFCLAKQIKDMSGVTVITNSLRVINELSASTTVKVIILGGQLRHSNQSFVGVAAQSFSAENYYANKMFFSCRGVMQSGVMLESDEREALVKRAMLNCSDKKIFMCDHSKMGHPAYIKLSTLDEMDTLITDKDLDEAWDAALESAKTEKILAL